MDTKQLTTLLVNCTTLLRLGNKLGLDLSNQVREVLHKGIEYREGTVEINYNNRFIDVPEMTPEEINTARYSDKILAIKAYKERTGLSLMESKLAVEANMAKSGYDFNKPRW